MALQLLQNLDAADDTPYFTTGNFAAADWRPRNNWQGLTIPGASKYYPRLGVFYMGGLPTSGNRYAVVDPNLQDNASSIFGTFTHNAGFRAGPVIGEWNKGTNEQKVYLGSFGSGGKLAEVDPAALSVQLVPNPYTNFGSEQSVNGNGTLDEGFYNIFGSASTFLGSWIIFETLNKAYACNARVRQGGTTRDNAYIEVDLTTGDAIEYFPTGDRLICRYDGGGGDREGPQIDGDSFSMINQQFFEDDDSTLSQPKGFLFMNSERLVKTGNLRYIYTQVVDWNPFEVTASPGNPIRVHARVRDISRIEVEENQIGSATNGVGTVETNSGSLILDPTTERVFLPSRASSFSGSLTTGEAAITIFSLGAELEELTRPAAINEVETNKVVSFQTQALGSLNEKISGEEVTATLQRVTTLGETLDVSGASPGDSIAVENGPITEVLAPPVEVRKNGTPLVEGGGNDYTVDFANGEIDFISPEPVSTEAYDIDYPHFETPADPPHGTLRGTTTRTDESGVAQFQAEYPDDADLENQVDQLVVTTD